MKRYIMLALREHIMAFSPYPLPYSYDALEPYIDAETMYTHYNKHYLGYLNKFNNAIIGTEFEEEPIEEILKRPRLPKAIRQNGGGYFNHTLFWATMTPEPYELLDGPLADQLEVDFGGFANFYNEFTQMAASIFGSGWAWLVYRKGRLSIISTENQNAPFSKGYTPLLPLDVWEHAYYLKYRNRRDAYIRAWWNVVNWRTVEQLFVAALPKK